AGRTSEIDLRRENDSSPDIVPGPKPPVIDKSPMPDKPPVTPLTPMPPMPARPSEPFIATPAEVVEVMLNLAKVTDADVVYDLGSGHARIAIMAVNKFKAKKAVGIDSNPDRITEAKSKAAEFAGKVDVRMADITTLTVTDLADATVVTIDRATKEQLE